MAEQTKKRKIMQGEVVSNKMNKTVIVKLVRTFRHPLLGKVMRTSKNYKVHDEKEEARAGDTIEFYQGRPVSKTKYMYLARVLNSKS